MEGDGYEVLRIQKGPSSSSGETDIAFLPSISTNPAPPLRRQLWVTPIKADERTL